MAEVLGAILDRERVADVSVQDPPLEQVIAKVFAEGKQEVDEETNRARPARGGCLVDECFLNGDRAR